MSFVGLLYAQRPPASASGFFEAIQTLKNELQRTPVANNDGITRPFLMLVQRVALLGQWISITQLREQEGFPLAEINGRFSGLNALLRAKQGEYIAGRGDSAGVSE